MVNRRSDHPNLRSHAQTCLHSAETLATQAAKNNEPCSQQIEAERRNEELHKSQNELDAARARYFNLCDLRQRLSIIEQDERRRIAYLLHECAVQDLVAIQLNLNRACQMLGDGEPGVRKILGDCTGLAENNANEIRSLAYDLHAPWLEHGGLRAGIQEYANQFSSRSGLTVTFDAQQPLPKLQQSNEIALYRVMQECLRNISSVCGAKRIWIYVSVFDNCLHMTIRDDRGASASSSPGSVIGTENISARERMSALGGCLNMTQSDEGVSFLAVLPLSEKDQMPSQRLCAS